MSGLQPVFSGGQVIAEGKHVTAGNASQLSDGFRLCFDGIKLASKEVYSLLALMRDCGCSTKADEMGIGPVYAVPKLLEKMPPMDDIDLWELNEAFAVQVVY